MSTKTHAYGARIQGDDVMIRLEVPEGKAFTMEPAEEINLGGRIWTWIGTIWTEDA